MNLSWRLALREIFASRSFFILLTICLALGLLGLTSIDALRLSIQKSLNARSKGFLAADIAVGARRALTTEEIQSIIAAVPKSSKISHLRESLTMVASSSNSRLIELRVIEKEYPFYGELLLSRQGQIDSSTTSKDLFDGPKVWVYPELMLQLGVSVGDQLKIGDLTVTITDTILRDSAGAGSDVSFAPPIYISSPTFKLTHLNKIGSTGYQSLLIKLSPEFDSPTVTETLAQKLNKDLRDASIQISTAKNSSEQIGRVMGYLSDYLGLTSLVALLLATIGQYYLFRNYFYRRFRDMAVLKGLGATNSQIAWQYLLQISLIAFVAAGLVLSLVALLMPALLNPLKSALQVELEFKLQLSTVFLVTTVSLLQSIFLALPFLSQIQNANVKELFESDSPTVAGRGYSNLKSLLYFGPSIILFSLLAVYTAHSLRVSLIFIAALVFSTAALTIVFQFALRILSRWASSLATRLAFTHMIRTPLATLTAFLALSLGILFANLIPQIEAGIREEISTPPGLSQPSLFLFDIQDDQLAQVKAALQKMNIEPMQVAPMVRARLTAINGKEFIKPAREESWSREKENENRSRNRGYNLSYRDQLSPAETLVKGSVFKMTNAEPQISVETRFAERMGFELNDNLSFDIQGVTVSGRIANFRKVRWTSFQPNFFLQFNNGPLNDAPKTFLITLPKISPDKTNLVQKEIVKQFSNVAIVDITRVIERLLGIIAQLSLALKIMAIVVTTVGLSMLFFVTHNQLFERRKEINLIKILGGAPELIRSLFIREALILAALAIVAGTGLSYLISYILSEFVFDHLYLPIWWPPLAIAIFIIVITFALTRLIVSQVMNSSAREILQSI